jgi:hypothetical protein
VFSMVRVQRLGCLHLSGTTPGARAGPLAAYGLACLEYLEFVAAGESFPVAWDEACEGSCCCRRHKPVLWPAARDEFGEVTRDEGVSGAHGVYSVYRDGFLPEYCSIYQGHGAVRAEFDDCLAWSERSYSPGQVFGFTWAYCYGGFVVAGKDDVCQRDDVAVEAARVLR